MNCITNQSKLNVFELRVYEVYEDYRNQLRKLMRAAEKKYHTDQILENKQN